MPLAAGRPRPFLYGEKARFRSQWRRRGAVVLSSHAALSFAIAHVHVRDHARLHPHSKASWSVLGVGGDRDLPWHGAGSRRHAFHDRRGGWGVVVVAGMIVPPALPRRFPIVPVAGDGSADSRSAPDSDYPGTYRNRAIGARIPSRTRPLCRRRANVYRFIQIEESVLHLDRQGRIPMQPRSITLRTVPDRLDEVPQIGLTS